MHRPAFFPVRSNDPTHLVNMILPEAVTRTKSVQAGDELHIYWLYRQRRGETPLAAITKGVKLSEELKKMRV